LLGQGHFKMVAPSSISASQSAIPEALLAKLFNGGGSAAGTQAKPLAGSEALSERDALQARVEGGGTLTPVEQGTLARLSKPAAQSAKPAAKAAAATGTVKGAKTAADFKVIGANKQDIADLNAALKYLQGTNSKGVAKSQTAVDLLAKLPKGTKLQIIHDGNDAYDPKTKTIFWDPRSALAVSSGAGNQSAALGLAHEIDHAVGGQKNPRPTGDAYDNTEERRVITGTETRIAKDLGEPTRTDHRGTTVVLGSSTAHTNVK
jgi:hypothetical protein